MPAQQDVYPAWAHSPEDVAAHFNVDLDHGLSDELVAKQRALHGFNELDHAPATPLWKLVLQQFDDTLVKILLLAAGISFALAWFDEGEGAGAGVRAFLEPAVIILILVLNAVVGVWQEGNAESALEALKEMSAETAKVFRAGHLVPDLPCRDLVPGDVVEVHTGDLVPADVRVVRLGTALFRVEQAALTGESAAVSKHAARLAPAACELHAKDNVLFAGTGVAAGTCRAVVYATGMRTEIGRIQAQIQAAAEEEGDTPLKKRLDEFGEALARIILYVCVAVWLINYRHFISWKTLPGSAFLPDPASVEFSLAKATFYFKVAVALAVAAIPEGLPAVITTCLALGTRKMARRNAIVRKLPSVETLGCTTVICSDKTGTLTTNQMAVSHVVTLAGAGGELRTLDVTGTSYNPADGEVRGLGAAASGAGLDAGLAALAATAALCNGARIATKHGHAVAVGQSTEAALLVLAEKLGAPDASERDDAAARAPLPEDGEVELRACDAYAARFRTLATLEFDRDRKSMSVVCAPTSPDAWPPAGARADGGVRRSSRLSRRGGGDGGGGAADSGAPRPPNVLLVKGAAECVLARCTHALLPDGGVVALEPAARAALGEVVSSLARRALRLLALAARPDLPAPLAGYDGGEAHAAHAALADPGSYEALESGLTFLGLAALRDPPRPEVRGAIGACRGAGIRVIVITGDNKATAETICADIGVLGGAGDEEDGSDDGASLPRSLTGTEFCALSEADKARVLARPGGLCISRAEPGHKQDVVRRLRDAGEVTAMTGDGVNDAPALKLADIGIAMGVTGTEVAKEAADMVLADDNFATVVAAVEEGRAIFNNMKAFIRYMISSNIGEVASIFLSAALGLPEGLIPVQLLWVNLVTDGPPATALGFNPPDPDIMSKPPRRGSDHFLTPWLLFRWVVVGCYVGFATVGAFATWYTSTTFLGFIDLSRDGHTPVTLAQLRDWESCPSWPGFTAANYTAGARAVEFADPCDYFTTGKAKASTLSLSVLVAIEMFNAANALSEDNSLVTVPVWWNPWLLLAMAVSFGLHFLILYVPVLADVFSIVPLSFQEWLLVLAYSLPVVLIDEVLKAVGRTWVNKSTAAADRAAGKAKLE
ncbi:hypothetical protein ACKKBG_A17970 [Auxenochlorella protothecoides x Auxenochlorella symbiontica]